MLARRSASKDVLLLSLLCGLVYFIAPTSHGLTNWQESKRAVVAREMHDRLHTDPWAWVVPTDNARPYLAKPPLMYWAQIGLATLLGHRSGELELRLTVALAGWLGVIATYFTTRRLLAPWDSGPDIVVGDENAYAENTAWWASLFLATGILYVRSSRIGELDILLVPFTVAAIGLIALAWRHAEHHARANWSALIGATLATCGAVMTKGPPALLTVALAAYGGIALSVAASRRKIARRFPESGGVPGTQTISLALVTIGFIGFLIAGIMHADSLRDIPGVASLGIAGAIVGHLLATLASRDKLLQLWTTYSRTHPVMVLGLPTLLFVGWGRAVAHLIPPGEISASLGEEIEDNLRILVPESPLVNLAASAYGVGLGSLAAIIAVIWIVRDRPVLPRTWFIVLAWVGLGLIAFSTLGKGVARYLTPVWPGVAILGAAWFTAFLRDSRSHRRLAITTTAVIVALGAGQGWWYAVGRESKYASRSPRAFVSSLLSSESSIDASRLGTFEFSTPAIDFYVGRAVESFHDVTPRTGIRFVGPRTIADLREQLADGTAFTLLIRHTQPPSMDPKPAVDCLLDAGFEIEPVTLPASFTIDNGRVRIDAVKVRVVPHNLMPAPAPQATRSDLDATGATFDTSP